MDSTKGRALVWCCLMLYNLLSSDEVCPVLLADLNSFAKVNEDIVLAILDADLLVRLIASFK